MPFIAVGLILLLLAGIPLFFIAPGQSLTLDFPYFGKQAFAARYVLWAFLPSIFIGYGVIFIGFRRQQGMPGYLSNTATLSCALLLFAGALIGAALGQIGLPRAMLLAVFTTVAFDLASRAIEAVNDGPVGVQTTWGGLGGGLGDWQISRAATLTGLTVVFALAAAASAITPAPSTAQSKSESSSGFEVVVRSPSRSTEATGKAEGTANAGSAGAPGTTAPETGATPSQLPR